MYKIILVISIFGLILASCAAGDPRFTPETPAGFWQGLWHGIISVIAFIISLFSANVKIYELNNTGNWYNFGFLLGAICIWGHGSLFGRFCCKRKKWRKCVDDEELEQKIEKKIKMKLGEWASSEDSKEWEDVGKKVEEKIKRKMKEWAEKE